MFADPLVAVAEADAIRSGNGAITLKAAAPLELMPAAEHQILFKVTYGELSHEWFVQPFYYPELVEVFGMPTLERSPGGGQVTVSLGR